MDLHMIDWQRYPNFSESEFRCRCGCETIKLDATLLEVLQSVRSQYGKPMKITSGYRCEKHPIEARKVKPGAHNSGAAADVQCSGREAYELLKLFCADDRVTGIGVNQKGRHHQRFLHVDVITNSPRPNLWSYS
jgi:zinc D-Ala-D-Ala carboxypeptidase